MHSGRAASRRISFQCNPVRPSFPRSPMPASSRRLSSNRGLVSVRVPPSPAKAEGPTGAGDSHADAAHTALRANAKGRRQDRAKYMTLNSMPAQMGRYSGMLSELVRFDQEVQKKDSDIRLAAGTVCVSADLPPISFLFQFSLSLFSLFFFRLFAFFSFSLSSSSFLRARALR